MRSNLLETLLEEIRNPKAREIYEITPTEQTDKFYKIVFVKYHNEMTLPYPLGKQDYEEYYRRKNL